MADPFLVTIASTRHKNAKRNAVTHKQILDYMKRWLGSERKIWIHTKNTRGKHEAEGQREKSHTGKVD